MSLVFSFVLMALKGVGYVLGGFLVDVYKVFGAAGIVCVGLIATQAGTLAYYQGLPFASYLVIPASVPLIGGFGVGNIPFLGDLAIGHVQTRVNEAVAGARHGFAVEQQNASAKAAADAEAQSKLQAQKVAAVYKALLTDEQARENQTSKDYTDALQRAARARKAAGLRCDALDDATADVLRKHGFQIVK